MASPMWKPGCFNRHRAPGVAYLDPKNLTCPGCGKRGRATWVNGSGPNSTSGGGPAYRSLKDAGPWIADTTRRHPFWAGRLSCPDCGAEVLKTPGTAEAGA